MSAIEIFHEIWRRRPWENTSTSMSMNEQVAYAVIDSELKRLRKSPHPELTALVGKPEVKQVIAEDGKSYQLEIQAAWDSKKGGDLRVIVSADDRGWRAFKPLTCAFVMRPDGKSVGESLGGY
jgi:hypothetical protein